jgi:uncharacterized protein with NAD-binding domain and iron-sulfur cluster
VPGAKQRVLVIGGGAAGATAAYQLAKHKDEFEVTLLTLGWRLGGKGASGRNRAKGDRIEEHGLHVWFGFYDNSFRLMRDAYPKLNRPLKAPLRTWDEAFRPCDNVILWEEWKGRWIPRRIQPPPRPGQPGDPQPSGFWQMAQVALNWMWSFGHSSVLQFGSRAAKAGLFEPNPLTAQAFTRVRELGGDEGGIDKRDLELPDPIGTLEISDLFEPERAPTHHLLLAARELARVHASAELDVPKLSDERLLSRMLGVLQRPWRRFFNLAMDNDDVRFAYMALDFMAGLSKGLVFDVLPHHSFDQLDDEEFRHWLRRHGVSQFTLDHAAWIKGYYDLAFGFENGDWRRPNLAAGTAVKDLLRIGFNYRGAMMWKMQAGMGDIVFAPLYLEMTKQGVDVRFFQRVRSLELTADKTAVERVWLQPQLELAGANYKPLFDCNGIECWPSEPDWGQVKDPDDVKARLAAQATTLEDEDYDSLLPEESLELGTDFDVVILAASVASVAKICPDLAADTGNPGFHRMLQHSHTVVTQAFQLWLADTPQELGWRDEWGPDPITTAYVEPFDTYSSMDQLIRQEHVKGPQGDPAGHVAYFCGPLPDVDAPDRQTAAASARRYALAHIDKYLRLFWPNAYDEYGHFRWELLCDDRHGVVGRPRFDWQYCRANHTGSERYVSTRAGTVKHRLAPDQSGYDNLFLAGDWTRNGIDGGCVEAAVISGMLAAFALSGVDKPLSANVYPFGGP